MIHEVDQAIESVIRQEALQGTAVEVESDGRLRLSGGQIVGAGDVEHLRPAR